MATRKPLTRPHATYAAAPARTPQARLRPARRRRAGELSQPALVAGYLGVVALLGLVLVGLLAVLLRTLTAPQHGQVGSVVFPLALAGTLLWLLAGAPARRWYWTGAQRHPRQALRSLAHHSAFVLSTAILATLIAAGVTVAATVVLGWLVG